MNMPDLKEARKRTKDKVEILYDKYKVPESVKHERVKKLLELSDSLEKSYYDKFKGKNKDVLIEEVNEFGSKGHTSNYLMVHTNEKLQKGEIYNLLV